MAVVGINHVRISVPADRQTDVRRFYGEWLGLQEIPASPDLAARGYIGFRVGSQRLDVGLEPEFRPARTNHPGFHVTDLESLRSRLESHGVQIVVDEPPTEEHRFYVFDPFGNRLEFDALE